MFAYLSQCDLLFEPGTKGLYSNLGMALLSYSLSLVCHQQINTNNNNNNRNYNNNHIDIIHDSFFELLSCEILSPMGMNHTSTPDKIDSKSDNDISWKCGKAFAYCDGFYSTLRDLMKLIQATLNHTRGILTIYLSISLSIHIKSQLHLFSFRIVSYRISY